MGEMRREYVSTHPTTIYCFLVLISLRVFLSVSRLTCDESPTESPSITTEQVLKIECNISITTNFMLTGIMNVCTILPIPRSSF